MRVRVLTNLLASTDVPVMHGRSSGASLHAKAIVVDGRFVVLGSMNLDPRSRMHNTEVAVLIESGDIGVGVAALFDEATHSINGTFVTRETGEEVHVLRGELLLDGSGIIVLGHTLADHPEDVIHYARDRRSMYRVE